MDLHQVKEQTDLNSLINDVIADFAADHPGITSETIVAACHDSISDAPFLLRRAALRSEKMGETA